MNAGPELDALVAEKVMGWKWLRAHEADEFDPIIYRWLVASTSVMSYQSLKNTNDPDRIGCIADGTEPVLPGALYNVPYFSTDIAAAWQVVEKMRSQWGPDVFVFAWSEYRNHEDHRNRCIIHYIDGMECAADALTMPLAICLAALKAVGAEVDTNPQEDST